MTEHTYDIYVSIPPDGGYSWVIVIISMIGFIIADGIGSSFFLYREHIAEDLGITTTMSAAIGSTYASLCLFLGPISSSICNLYGFRWMLIVGGVLTSSGTGLTYFSHNFQTSLLLFGIMAGIGGGFALIPISTPVGYWFDKRRPIAVGLSTSGSGIGMLLIPYTTQCLMETTNWKFAYIYHSGISFTLQLCIILQCLLALFTVYIVLGIFLIPLPPVNIIPKQLPKGKTIHPKKIKGNRHHGYAISIYPEQRMKPVADDPWMQASMSRVFKKDLNKDERKLPKSSSVVEVKTRNGFWDRFMKICSCCKKEIVGHRPMYKSDIFYQGSIYRIQKIEKIPTRHALEYSMSVSKLPTKRDIAEEQFICVCCPEAVRRTLLTMFDVAILKEVPYLFFLLSNFFFTMGSCLPVLYIYTEALQNESFPKQALVWLVPSIGIGKFLGQMVAGTLLQLFPLIHAFHLSLAVDFTITLMTLGITLTDIYVYYFLYAVTFGICFGIFTSVRSLILVDFLGLEQLTSATGILFAVGGLAVLLGPPTGDFLVQISKDIDSIFYFAGGLLALSVIFLGPMIFLQKRDITDEPRTSLS